MTYEVEINGQIYEIEAPNEAALREAVQNLKMGVEKPGEMPAGPSAEPQKEEQSRPSTEINSLKDAMAWREQTMGDLGRREPQTPQETAMAGAGALGGLAAAGTAATAPMSIPGLGSSAAGLTASLVVGNWIERKLGLPAWTGDIVALVLQKKPRGKLATIFKDIFKRAGTEAEKEGVEVARKTIAKEVTKEIMSEAPSETMGTTSRTAALAGTLPARATLTRIPMAPKRPGIARMTGGSKAQRAWLESQGLIPGAMGPDDVLAMRARGATPEEIEAALLRAARPSPGMTVEGGSFGHPSPPIKEKPANWKPPTGPEPTRAPSVPTNPTVRGGTAVEASAAKILDSVRTWRTIQKLSKPQIEDALRNVYGIPKKEARSIIQMVL